jgi:hypothetical protein
LQRQSRCFGFQEDIVKWCKVAQGTF